jgi:hypothetical protein
VAGDVRARVRSHSPPHRRLRRTGPVVLRSWRKPGNRSLAHRVARAPWGQPAGRAGAAWLGRPWALSFRVPPPGSRHGPADQRPDEPGPGRFRGTSRQGAWAHAPPRIGTADPAGPARPGVETIGRGSVPLPSATAAHWRSCSPTDDALRTRCGRNPGLEGSRGCIGSRSGGRGRDARLRLRFPPARPARGLNRQRQAPPSDSSAVSAPLLRDSGSLQSSRLGCLGHRPWAARPGRTGRFHRGGLRHPSQAAAPSESGCGAA